MSRCLLLAKVQAHARVQALLTHPAGIAMKSLLKSGMSYRRDGSHDSDVVGRLVEMEDVADGDGKHRHCQRARCAHIHQLPASSQRTALDLLPFYRDADLHQAGCQGACCPSPDLQVVPLWDGLMAYLAQGQAPNSPIGPLTFCSLSNNKEWRCCAVEAHAALTARLLRLQISFMVNSRMSQNTPITSSHLMMKLHCHKVEAPKGVQLRRLSLVALADLLHGEQQDEPRDAHHKLAPLEVGRPRLSKKVVQLLVHRVMAREADGG